VTAPQLWERQGSRIKQQPGTSSRSGREVVSGHLYGAILLSRRLQVGIEARAVLGTQPAQLTLAEMDRDSRAPKCTAPLSSDLVVFSP
jgi:hypothetical protein